jgi:hypothetical protein
MMKATVNARKNQYCRLSAISSSYSFSTSKLYSPVAC